MLGNESGCTDFTFEGTGNTENFKKKFLGIIKMEGTGVFLLETNVLIREKTTSLQVVYFA